MLDVFKTPNNEEVTIGSILTTPHGRSALVITSREDFLLLQHPGQGYYGKLARLTTPLYKVTGFLPPEFLMGGGGDDDSDTLS